MRTIFEQKLSHYLGIAEKASCGYYIANGVYHQNLEKVNLDEFVEAVKIIPKMLYVAFQNETELLSKDGTLFSKAFFNDLKRSQQRFEGISENQLAKSNNENNVAEIISEIHLENLQVLSQLKKVIEYHLTVLPIIFFKIIGNDEKASFFNTLQSRLHTAYLTYNDVVPEFPEINYSKEVASSDEIFSWFVSKSDAITQQKIDAEKQREIDKENIALEKQKAVDEANDYIAKAMAEAKKVQEEAMRMMAELQKKHGF